MAKITTITNPLTGQPTQVDQLDHTAQEIDDAIARALPSGAIDVALQNKADTSSVYTKTEADNLLQKKVNPNLLDNWYFGRPVNQRGVTSGTAGWNEYFLDRWQGNCIYDVTKGYLEVGSGSYLIQKIENGGSIPYPVTFSILFQDGTFGYQTVYADGGFSLIGANVKGHADSQIHGENPYISYANNSGSTVGIIAVKLELGTVQTLAHQENGNWVLNEIPNYGEQLRMCQRYYYRDTLHVGMDATGVYGNQNRALLFFPQTMRTIPSVSVTPASGYTPPNALALSPNEVLLYTASDVNWGLQILEATADLL